MFSGTYFLATERLGFRTWSRDDLPLALSLWGDFNVTRFFGGPFSAPEVQQRLDREIESLRKNGFQYWPVFLLADGEFVGCCGLRSYASEAKIFELGFHLRPVYWGKGLATESAQAVVKFASDSFQAEGLFAGHHPENMASSKVLAKLGFQFTHEELYPPTGKLHRCYFMRLGK